MSSIKNWVIIKDGNDIARELFEKHYSRYKYKDGRKPKLFVGPGQKLVLLNTTQDAIFAWRKFKSDNGQDGVNCAIFRNESKVLSSILLLEAEQIAWERWPTERLYTYVNPNKVKSVNPGYCFKIAGWRNCGITKVNKLLIMEKFPIEVNSELLPKE